METLYDLVNDLPESAALRAPPREYNRRELRQTAFKTGNFLRHCGVHEGATVAVADDRAPEAVLALLGAALLGARVRFGATGDLDARAYVGPTEALDDVSLPAGGQYVGYGERPGNPSRAHFERDVWSENPAFPPVSFSGDAVALAGDDRYTHAVLLDAARRLDYDSDDVVAVRAPLAYPGTVVAGVLAPLVAGATILLPDSDTTGTVAVTTEDAPEQQTVDPTLSPERV
ncbi:AMP-binding protein [Salarchaeum sp. JOR-1]|uniref:AMP-binding protein n=1 Tax=Salarchaeum sp. JOR-1 TaxID=2599399 RepID=UPI0011987F82|nr:AMP-binding protein [Salarchaeum sp. JOR-1]QDX41456.1 AMP-binding protein [Salarchaeum sp. JOR-1]